MKVEVLVATMNQDDYSIIDNMNIKSDAIVANQCGKNSIESIIHNGKNITFISLNERGVGKNRNNALMRSNADICILADDDMRFCEDYVERVIRAFEVNPTADVILFNFIGKDSNRTETIRRIGRMNYMKYGAARIAFKREKLSYAAIYFNQNFGGGCKHNCGEDTIFLNSCLKKGLKILHVPEEIAVLDDTRESTWFKGYNEKFFYDRAILHAVIYKDTLKAKILISIFNYIYILRHRSLLSKDITFFTAYRIMNKALSDFL